MPDLAFVLDGRERWAVEFERTAKGCDPLEQILEGYREAELRGDVDGVLYVCENDYIAGRVETLRKWSPEAVRRVERSIKGRDFSTNRGD